MIKTTNLSSLIWSSADDVLRGLFKPSEYGRVILPFVVMRRLDCVLEPKKDEVYKLYETYKDKLTDPSPVILKQVGLPFFNRSRYDLTRIKSDPNNVLMNFNNYVQGYSQNVLDIIENFSITPLIEKLHKQKRLYLLIDKFTEFDLHPSVIDNHQMGSVYEELLRKFSEISNEESGDHFTPRDVVKLLVSLVFGGDKEDLIGEGKIRSVFDPCCGTGGMLTIGKEWIHENINPDLKIDLYGQELNDVTYSICKSDLLMMDENPDNIHGPCSSISDDRLEGRKFDYMITNPPFGVSWKSEQSFVKEESKDPNGRFFAGLPKVSDGSFLFLQHLISKMSPNGSRIGVVLNGTPLSSGDAGSGESNIRKWILENDWIETIIRLPENMFFNTDITTYIWIITNKKHPKRKGLVHLIDGENFFDFLRQPLGDKKKEISDDNIDHIIKEYNKFTDSEISKIVPYTDFKYRKAMFSEPLLRDGEIVKDRNNNPKVDSSKNDAEYIPYLLDLEKYFDTYIKPYKPNSFINREREKIGYQIGFSSYFHKNSKLENVSNILSKITLIEDQVRELRDKLFIGQDHIFETVTGKNKSEEKCIDSGIEWIGKIPSNWKVEPLFNHFTNNKVKNVEDRQDVLTLSYGKIKYRDLSKNFGLLPESFRTYQVVKPQYIIFRPTDLQNDKKSLRVGHVKIQGVITSAYIGLSPIRSKDTRYFYYYLHLCDLMKVFYGLGGGLRQSISFQDFKRFPLLIPPKEEQVMISDSLDSFDETIKSIIDLEKEKMVLLEQLKRSLVFNFVTRNNLSE